MTHNANNSTFTTSGLNQRFKGNTGEDGARGELGTQGINGTNGPANMIINIQTDDYTLVLADANVSLIAMSKATANDVTIPPNSDVLFPIGAQIMITQDGVGTTTVVPGAGVTILSEGGATDLAAQYAGATIIQKETNVWYLFGNIA